MSNSGETTTFRFPIASPVVVSWTIDALKRVLARMLVPEIRPTDGVELPFRDLRYADVSRIDGQDAPPRPLPEKEAYTPGSEDIKQ